MFGKGKKEAGVRFEPIVDIGGKHFIQRADGSLVPVKLQDLTNPNSRVRDGNDVVFYTQPAPDTSEPYQDRYQAPPRAIHSQPQPFYEQPPAGYNGSRYVRGSVDDDVYGSYAPPRAAGRNAETETPSRTQSLVAYTARYALALTVVSGGLYAGFNNSEEPVVPGYVHAVTAAPALIAHIATGAAEVVFGGSD